MSLPEKGARVEFLGFGEPDEYSRLRPGTLGTVRLVDALGTIHVEWDDGGSLGLVAGVDHYRIFDDELRGSCLDCRPGEIHTTRSTHAYRVREATS